MATKKIVDQWSTQTNPSQRDISNFGCSLEIAAALVEGKLNTSSRESEIPLGNVPVCVFTRPI